MIERPIPLEIMAAVELVAEGQRKADAKVNQLRAHYPRPSLPQRISRVMHGMIFPNLVSDMYNGKLKLVGSYAAVVAKCEARGEDIPVPLVSFGNHLLSSLPFRLREQALSSYREGYLWGVKLEVGRLLQIQQEVA